jgi:hypothetical protein
MPERQTESSDAEMSGEHLATLLRQVSKTSIDEIDSLIVELKTLYKKLQTDGDRITPTNYFDVDAAAWLTARKS